MDKFLEMHEKLMKELNSHNTLFHYTNTTIALEKILLHNKLKLSTLNNTNDPDEYKFIYFDSMGFGEQDMDKYRKAITTVNKTRQNHFRVVCFSTNTKNTKGYFKSRMWAQYGENHKGLCLAFNKRKLLKIIKRNIEYIHADKVKYNLDGRIRGFTFDSSKLNNSDLNEFSKDHLITYKEDLFFRKNRDFQDEDEYRILSYSESDDQLFVDIQGSLTAILIGDKFPDALLPSLAFFHKIYNTPCRRVTWNKGRQLVLYCGPQNNKFDIQFDKLGLDPRKSKK